MVVTLVQELQQRGDSHLHLVHGDVITSEKNLRPNSQDDVHLSVEGAALLAESLTPIIRTVIDQD